MPIFIDVSSEQRQCGKTTVAAEIVHALRAAGFTVQTRCCNGSSKEYLEGLVKARGRKRLEVERTAPVIVVRDEMPWPRPEVLLDEQAHVLDGVSVKVEAARILLRHLLEELGDHRDVLRARRLPYQRLQDRGLR